MTYDDAKTKFVYIVAFVLIILCGKNCIDNSANDRFDRQIAESSEKANAAEKASRIARQDEANWKKAGEIADRANRWANAHCNDSTMRDPEECFDFPKAGMRR